MSKELSIIIPVYNNIEVKNAIESVILYKSDEMELIVMDGGSKMETIHCIEPYMEWIDKFVSEPDKGINDAINKAIKISKGKWILTLAADDKLICNPLNVLKKYRGQKCDLLCGSIIISNGYDGYLLSKSDFDFRKLDYECSLRHPASFFLRKAYEKFGMYDETIKCAGDREIFLRFRNQGAKIIVIQDYVVVFSLGGISTKNPIKYGYKDDLMISDRYGVNKIKTRLFFINRCIHVYGGKVKDIFGVAHRKMKYVTREELNAILIAEHANVSL